MRTSPKLFSKTPEHCDLRRRNLNKGRISTIPSASIAMKSDDIDDDIDEDGDNDDKEHEAGADQKLEAGPLDILVH